MSAGKDAARNEQWYVSRDARDRAEAEAAELAKSLDRETVARSTAEAATMSASCERDVLARALRELYQVATDGEEVVVTAANVDVVKRRIREAMK